MLKLSQCDYVPCTAHSLNLVGKHAAEACSAGVAMFSFIQNVYNLSSASAHRWAVLKKHLEGLPDDKYLSETRWSAPGDGVKASHSGYKGNAKALEEITADPEQSAETRNEGSSLLHRLERLGIVLTSSNSSRRQVVHFRKLAYH